MRKSTIFGALTACMLLSFSVAFALTNLPNTGLPEGCRAPTQGEIDAGWKRGFSICPTDIKQGFSEDVGAAKKHLFSIARNLRNSQAPPDWEHIKPLNPTFAVCAANFLKAYADEHGPVAVVSACRSCPGGDPTENARAGGARNSRHMRGLALDINPAGGGASYTTMWSYAQKHPEYGVCFPHLSDDRPHMTLAGTGGGEGARCAQQGVRKACSGAPAYTGSPAGGGGGGGLPATPSLPPVVPPTNTNGVPGCPTGYFYFENQCHLEEGEEEGGSEEFPVGQRCTLDAKICPDGTAVGRTGPNCSFAPCSTGGCPIGTNSVVVSAEPLVIQCQTVCPIGYAYINNQCQPYGGCRPGTTLIGNQCMPIQGNPSCTMNSIFNNNCQQNNPYNPYQQQQQQQGGFPGAGGGAPSGLNRSGGAPIGGGQSGFPISSAQQTTPRTLSPNTVPANILDRLNALTNGRVITGTSSSSTVSGARRDPIFSSDFGTIADLGTTGTALGVRGEAASGDSFGTPGVRIIAGTTFGAGGADNADILSSAAPLSFIQSALLNIRSTLLGILAYLRLLQ